MINMGSRRHDESEQDFKAREAKRKRESRAARARGEQGPGRGARLDLNPKRPAQNPPVDLSPGQELDKQTIHVNSNGDLIDRYDKTKPAAVEPKFLTVPEAHHVTKTTTRIDRDGRVGMQYITAKPDEVAREAAFWEACERMAAKYDGLARAVPVPDLATNDDLLQVYPIGDPHIGMLSWAPETGDHFDTTIACRELLCCVRELVRRAPPAKRAIITNLGDALHAQDDMNRTPGHGNQLDVDGRFAKVLDALHMLLLGMIDAALEKHEHVTIRNLPGNHDPRVAAELMYWLRAWYRNEPRVTVADAYAAHQYDHFGTNLLGWHHGDRSKKGELPAIMASDHDGGGTGLWGLTAEHVWHVGHEHHTTVLETPSCFTWVHNTLAGRDAYHAGRYRAKRMLRGFTYHREFGEDAIQTVSLARVRAALKRAA